jgi:KamA family protein
MLSPKKMKFYGIKDIDTLPELRKLSSEERFNLKVVAQVLPFRVNNYVLEDLIDWDNIPEDPIYQLTFLQKEMLQPEQFDRMAAALSNGHSDDEIKMVANKIRMELNPHPAGQMTLNVPKLGEEPVQGMQHKYRETVLVFPSSGQTCHSYCTFCFRWAQFVGMNDLKFATEESKKFQKYIANKKEVTDVLFTGGDPMVMNARNLAEYIEPLLTSEFEHVQTIRIGTKSVSYWPYKYITDKDADDIFRLFEKVVESGKHLAIMGHYNHWKELSTEPAHEAIRRIRNTGAQIRTQSPLVRFVNDDPQVWATMWKEQVKLGCIPYYFFVERNTGAKEYFSIPLFRSYEIFTEAYRQVSGLARTVRGPSMSALPGKVVVTGITEIKGEKVFILTMIQGRNPAWVQKPFFAKYNDDAVWLSDLKPALGKEKFFYSDELDKMMQAKDGQMFFDAEGEDDMFVEVSSFNSED